MGTWLLFRCHFKWVKQLKYPVYSCYFKNRTEAVMWVLTSSSIDLNYWMASSSLMSSGCNLKPENSCELSTCTLYLVIKWVNGSTWWGLSALILQIAGPPEGLGPWPQNWLVTNSTSVATLGPTCADRLGAWTWRSVPNTYQPQILPSLTPTK